MLTAEWISISSCNEGWRGGQRCHERERERRKAQRSSLTKLWLTPSRPLVVWMMLRKTKESANAQITEGSLSVCLLLHIHFVVLLASFLHQHSPFPSPLVSQCCFILLHFHICEICLRSFIFHDRLEMFPVSPAGLQILTPPSLRHQAGIRSLQRWMVWRCGWFVERGNDSNSSSIYYISWAIDGTWLILHNLRRFISVLLPHAL